MKTLKIAALAGALALAGAGHALAGNYTATYTGTVASYSYGSGDPAVFEELFGYGATNITGFAFSAAVNYTTDAGGAFTDATYSGSGVASFAGDTPVISSVIFTVNNDPTHSFTFTPDFYANVESASAGFHESAGYDFQNQFQAYIATSGTTPGDVSTPFSSDGTGFDPVINEYNYVTDGNETLVWDTTHITVAPTSAAPEPTTWALMMAGVALTGFALRRRTRATLAAA